MTTLAPKKKPARKLSAGMKAALALLPLTPEEYARRVPAGTRKALAARGLVRVGRRWDPLQKDPAKRPLLAYARSVALPPGYRAVRAASDASVQGEEGPRPKWPAHYVKDLYRHDKLALLRNDPPTFGWVLYDCGTDLINPWADYPRSEGVLEYLDASRKYHGRGRTYYWDGASLKPATWDELRELLARDQGRARARRGRRLAADRDDVHRLVGRQFVLADEQPENLAVREYDGVEVAYVPVNLGWGRTGEAKVWRGEDGVLHCELWK